MSPDDRIRLLLEQIHASAQVSHRSLAETVGISVGLTNQILNQMIRRRFVRATQHVGSRRRYYLTARGLMERARTGHAHFVSTVEAYSEARSLVRAKLRTLSEANGRDAASAPRVVFYGAGELAEIAYACVQETGLELTGVIDDAASRPFFGVPVLPSRALSAAALDGRAFDHIVITSLTNRDAIEARLHEVGISRDEVIWL